MWKDFLNRNNRQAITVENNTTKKSTLKILFGIIIVITLLVLINNVYTLRPSEYAIVKQFGKVMKVVDTEGAHIKVPFVQNVTIMPKSNESSRH